MTDGTRRKSVAIFTFGAARCGRSAGRNQISGRREGRQQPAAKYLGMTDRALRRADLQGGGQRPSLENPGGRAQAMLHQANAVIELGRPALPPQRDLGGTMIESLQNELPHPRVASEQIGRDCQGLRAGASLGPRTDRSQGLFEVESLDSKNLQWPIVLAVGYEPRLVGHEHGDIPPRHGPVKEPTAGAHHHVDDVARDDVEPVSHVFFVGAKSRASVSAYCLNTSVNGIEGSSNHIVSIPWMKARISTALTTGSISVRYRPSAWPRRMSSATMSIACWCLANMRWCNGASGRMFSASSTVNVLTISGARLKRSAT